MPHEPTFRPPRPGAPAVRPVPGNTGHGGACYDPATGQALYAVLHNGRIEVFRTVDGARSLATVTGSVVPLSTIDASGTWIEPTAVALQRIDGDLFASVNGKTSQATTGRAGHWIYRDTSPARDGSGPWIRHGTIRDIAAVSDGHFSGTAAAGEILVVGNRWATNTADFFNAGFDLGVTAAWYGVATSDDRGVTWTLRFSVGWGPVGGIYGNRWARNFARWGSSWYVGGNGTTDVGKHYRSTDLASWTSIGGLGTGIGAGYAFPVSDTGAIYRTSGRYLDAATAAPETEPTWTRVFDFDGNGLAPFADAFPYIVNIGPDEAPFFAAIRIGSVLGFVSGGWQVGRVGLG